MADRQVIEDMEWGPEMVFDGPCDREFEAELRSIMHPEYRDHAWMIDCKTGETTLELVDF